MIVRCRTKSELIVVSTTLRSSPKSSICTNLPVVAGRSYEGREPQVALPLFDSWGMPFAT